MSGAVGTPLRRGTARRRSDAPPSAGEAQNNSEKNAKQRRLSISDSLLYVDPEDPDVHVKLPERVSVDEDIVVYHRRRKTSLRQAEEPPQDDDDDELVTISSKRLNESRDRMQASAEANSDRSADKNSSSSKLPVEMIDLCSTSTRASCAHAVTESDEQPPVITTEELAVRRAEEYLALQRSHVRTSNNTLADIKLLTRAVMQLKVIVFLFLFSQSQSSTLGTNRVVFQTTSLACKFM